jgi:peptidoglycan/xylan/chitin deacetylase (PgdA/CDA1 family)
VRATFGITGRWAAQNGDLVRRMARDGDALMNHTYDHRSFTGQSTHTTALSSAQRAWELTNTDRVVERLAGRSTKPFFRPPFGDYDAATLALVRRLGYFYSVMWTVDSLGWEGLTTAEVLRRCERLLTPGDIYLMHVGGQSRDAFALSGLLAYLRRNGYRAVTVPQMVRSLG